jgi:hypothetical protein
VIATPTDATMDAMHAIDAINRIRVSGGGRSTTTTIVGTAPAAEIRTTGVFSIPVHHRFISPVVNDREIARDAAPLRTGATIATRAPTAHGINCAEPGKPGEESATFHSSTVRAAPVLIREILVKTTAHDAAGKTNDAEMIALAIPSHDPEMGPTPEDRSVKTRVDIDRNTMGSGLTRMHEDETDGVSNVPDGTIARVRIDVSIRARTLLFRRRLESRIGGVKPIGLATMPPLIGRSFR